MIRSKTRSTAACSGSPHSVRFFASLLSAGVFIASQAVGHAATRARFTGETVLNDPPTRISAGFDNTCQVREDGVIRCWGGNDRFQSPGSSSNHSIPGFLGTFLPIVAVATGYDHTCSLLTDGRIECAGKNNFGQLGSNGDANQTVIGGVLVAGIFNTAVAISSGASHTCALLRDGTARCWGSNSEGQLGDNTRTNRPAPVSVQGLGNAIAISGGGDHTCALIADGTVRCWGFNGNGELGDGTRNRKLTPVTVKGLTNAVAIASGTVSTCALVADGTVFCWGNNSYGQIGNNSTAGQLLPVPVLGLTNAVSITAGLFHTCAGMADGTARCWGLNQDGQLGHGTNSEELTPVTVEGLINAVAIAAGGNHTCAVLADNSARCWGLGTSGQLGNGSFVSSAAPVVVIGGGGSITARDVAAGRNHTCVVRASSAAACWGSNATGQVGDGTTVNRPQPVAVPNLSNVVAIAGGEAHTCALLAGGTVSCWGLNSSGELGDDTTSMHLNPNPVPGLTNVVGIATGGDLGESHTCALISDGTVRCWGANGHGQLGDNTTSTRLSPVVVKGLGTAVAIATGAFHSCAVLADGTARCWGANNRGQLGDNTSNPRLVPVPVVNLTTAVSITSGDTHSCALLADGSARCWGGNSLGQLGNGSNVSPQLFPTPVATLEGAVGIAGGFGHSCSVQANGTARCWGGNGLKELGDRTTNSSSIPIIVKQADGLPLDKALNIATGRHHSCALRSTGGVTCWGDNTFGQLATLTISSTITIVPSLTLNIDPAVSVKSNGRVAEVTVIAVCDEGKQLQFDVTLEQDATSGSGRGSGKCSGRLERYPANVPANGPNQFGDGAAMVSAEAVIRDGSDQETQAWTRAVNISIAP